MAKQDVSASADQPFDELSITELVRRITDGTVAIDAVPVNLRRACVAHLTIEGFSSTEIASLLKMSDRTVQRDRAAARKDYAIAPDLYLGDELLGEYHRLTMASIQRLTRLARDCDTPPYARLWAEESISRCYNRLLEIAQKLRYVEDGGERMRYHTKTDEGVKARKEEMEAISKEMLRKPVW